MAATLSPGELPLAPLGAGDLIDRAVRLYRRHLFVLIRTAAPPVIIAAAGWIVFSISMQRVFITKETSTLLLYILAAVVALAVMLGGYLLTLVVMGGATRTLVAHLLRNDPVTARATYTAVRTRFWGLVGASVIVMVWIGISLMVALGVWQVVLSSFSMLVVLLMATAPPWLPVVLFLLGLLVSTPLA